MSVVHLLLAAVLTVLTPSGPAPSGAAAADVLHAWDARRAAAWADADPTALRSLYTDRSAAGRTDVAMLRTWRARGLRVTGMRTQLLAVQVRRTSASRLVLVVTDRLVAGVAVGPTGRFPLPTDRASTRLVVLRRVGGEWRMAQARPVRTTSSTVGSRNR